MGKIIHNTFFGIRKSAILETTVALTSMTLFNLFLMNGDRFINSPLHPFWIVILIVTVHYGVVEGVFAAFMSTLFLYVGNVPPQLMTENSFHYSIRLTVLPFLWFFIAFMLGEVRDRIERDKTELSKKLHRKEKELSLITTSYEKLKETKESLEKNIASQEKTTASTFRILKSLSVLNPATILLRLETIVTETLRPEKFSVFVMGPNGFEAASSYKWSEQDHFKRRFTPDDPLSLLLLSERRIVSIINREDEKILNGEGVLAAPLINTDTHEIFGMLKIEKIDFKKLHFSNIETFRILCELIGLTYTNALQYKKTSSKTLHHQDSPFFSYAFYVAQSNYLIKLAEQYKFPLTILKIKVNSLDQKTEFDVKRFFKIMNIAISMGAMLFNYKEKWNEFLVLFPNFDLKQAENFALQVVESFLKEPCFANFRLDIKADTLFDPKKNKEENLELFQQSPSRREDG